MDIGIGLPTTLTVDGPTVVAWARRAEERGFATLGTIDRLVYPNYDTITALAAAAGVWCVRVHNVGPNADAVRAASAWEAAR